MGILTVEPVNIDALANSIDENKLPDDILRYNKVRAKELDRIFTERCKEAINANDDFAYECNLREDQQKNIPLFNEAGYELVLIYIWLDNIGISKRRVEKRVAHGGHHVGEESIRENYTAGLKSLDSRFRDHWDEIYIFDNSIDINFQDSNEIEVFPLLLHIKNEEIQYRSDLIFQKENIANKLPLIYQTLHSG